MRGALFRAGISAGAVLVFMGLPGLAEASGRRVPLVVELFTSQGCSSCPPANANLIKLRGRSDVLALSFSVTYWDSLGWKDVFGQEKFTDRQSSYETNLGHDGPFTPQMVVNGSRDTVGNDFSSVEGLLSGSHLSTGPAIELSSTSVNLAPGAAPRSGTDIWLVRYDPNVVNVAVGRGENTGRTLPHTNVVHELRRLGSWTGSAVRQTFEPASAGLRTAILVQVPNGGPILAAATD
ncbi:hypothetical protein GCM10007874_70540 [Labrys miyagiensis]|uniref:DUF1223 domain-containing protein n=1 Tax=Labrys miyagiensis TaxID=346912 RepID=A0ABQ6CUK3_9HYPH|nr:DUF1223 domain-containing protein [Labrys miyagiensis]GLS24033.1 hypothetical protein GCM10007874_70540 [Labrys miyagiensis]